MSKRVGFMLGRIFIGFHFYNILDKDYMAISPIIFLEPGRFLFGLLMVVYGVEFEIDWSNPEDFGDEGL